MTNGKARRAWRWLACMSFASVLACAGEADTDKDSMPPFDAGYTSPSSGAVGAQHAEAGAGSVGLIPSGTSGHDASANPGPAASGVAAGGREAGAATSMPTDYTPSTCPGATPNTITGERRACDGEIRCGGAASCRATTESMAMQAPDCSGGKCIPDAIVIAGRVRLKPCEGTGGTGVCVPLCIALVRNPRSSVFPTGEAGCGTEEVCAPCLHPLDGSDTGACRDMCAD